MITFQSNRSNQSSLQLEVNKWGPFLQELTNCSNDNKQEVLAKINSLFSAGDLEISGSIANFFPDLEYQVVTKNGIPLLLKKEVDEQMIPEANASAQLYHNPFLPFDLYSSQLELKTNEAFQRAKDDNNKDPVFEQILNKMGLGLFAEAKKELGQLLKSIEDKDIEKSIAGFQLMSEIHLKEGKYPEAAGILWYAKKLDEEGISHRKIDTQLDFIERSLLRKATHANGPIRGITQSGFDQEKLRELREKIKKEYGSIEYKDNFERAQALRCLYRDTITKGLKDYIDELAQDVIKQIADWGQKVPCDYALIGLGSLAREEMTPYSDFEFSILIDSENENDKEFFRLFTNLLHLRFINLGETILPSLDIQCLDWVYDTITPQGLSFDGKMPTACKTPLGKKRNQEGDYELIHSPQEMSQLQFINVKEPEQNRLWILKRYHLPSILSACTYVTGSNQGIDLVSEYQKKVQTILEETEGKQRAFDLMKDDLDHFKPHLEEEESGKHYNVKKDLYRLPNTMFDALANYFCLKTTSTWERIEELKEKEILTSKAAQDLKELIMLSQELRLSTYLEHGCQKNHLDIDTQKSKLQELYYRVFPFVAAMEMFCSEIENGFPDICLKKERFYEDSSFHQGIIAFRHMNYLEAYRCLSLEVFDTLDYYEVLGAVENTLAKYKEAEKTYLKAIDKKPSCELYLKLGNVRQSLAQYKKDKYGDESAEEAFFKANELAKDDALLQERIYRALAYLYKECGDYDSAREYSSICTKISKARTLDKKIDSEYGVILDLDLAKAKELKAKILHNIDNEFKKSEKLFNDARTILKGYYRREDHPAVLRYEAPGTNYNEWNAHLGRQKKALKKLIAILGEKHPDVASEYNNIGGTLGKLGQYKEALKYLGKALKIRITIFGEEHPDVAISYNNVGGELKQLGYHNKALEHQQKALEMQLRMFGEKHHIVAISYNNVGNTLALFDRNEEALEHLQKALEMQRAIFDEKHTLVAIAYNNLGGMLGKFGYPKEALEHQEKALKIRLEIFEEKHLDVATTYKDMGDTLNKLSEHEKALEQQQKALEIRRLILGENHPDVARSFADVGVTFKELDKYKEALENLQKALEMQRVILGEKHPDVAILYNNVGGMYLMLREFSLAISSVKCALDIYQSHPAYQLTTKIVDIHKGLVEFYKFQNNNKKSTEHLKESQKLSREIDNQKIFQKNEVLLKDLLLNKEYQEAYQLFIKLPKYLKEATEFLCPQMQTALLCPGLNKKTQEKYIQNAETALNKDEGSIPTQMKLCINLAAYWLKANKWEKVNECITHLQKLLDKAPTFCYQYTLLDLLPFGEDPLIEGECIPVEILRNFIALKMYQGKKNHQILSIVAKQLLQKVNALEIQGHKIEEIKIFCLECL